MKKTESKKIEYTVREKILYYSERSVELSRKLSFVNRRLNELLKVEKSTTKNKKKGA